MKYRDNLFVRIAVALLLGFGAAGGAHLAHAANISLLTGPNDPSQGQVTVNQLIQSINTGVTGVPNIQYVSAASPAGTAENTLLSYSIPANTLSAPGKTLRITCWGATAANGNNKTMKLYYGASSITTATAATNAKGWYLELIVTRQNTSATQVVFGKGQVDTTNVTPYNNAGSDSMAAAVLTKCTGTDGSDSAGDILANGLLVEILQ